MARCIKMRQVLSAVILFSTVLKFMLVEDGQGIARKDAAPLGTMDTDSKFFPGRALSDDSSSQSDVAAMTEPCHHQRNTTDLKKQLEVLRKHVIVGNSAAVKYLLDKWSAHDVYVHNLNNLSPANDQDYPQIQCSDLDFLARYQVSYAELVYDQLHQVSANVSYMTMLELALHMTKSASERALSMAMKKDSVDVGNQGERSEDRVRIIRLLLEKGFLWGSGDLVCKVVHPESGYHTEVREAFVRTILHDLVRDLVHMNRTRIEYLRQHCGNVKDGVVWILGSAPGAFTLLGVLSHETVLMKAAQDDTNHDEAFIDFPELIDLHKVLQASVTTVDQDGWNAEMHAARVLKEAHVKLLEETTLEVWRQQGRDAFSIFFLWESVSDNLSGACIFLALNVNILAYIGACFFMCCLLLYFFMCFLQACPPGARFCSIMFDYLLSCVGCQGGCSLLCVEMLLRVLWLLTVNAAFLNFLPELTIAWETQTNPFRIPSVSTWNPLPDTVKVICCFCIIALLWFGSHDYLKACKESRENLLESNKSAKPDDLYQDPTFHLVGCVCVFGLMTLLMIIYVNVVLKPVEMDPKKLGLWLGSLLVQMKITLEGTLDPEEQRVLQKVFQQALDAPGEKNDDKDYQAVWEFVRKWCRWACCMNIPHNEKMWGLLMFVHKKNLKELQITNKDGEKKEKLRTSWSCWEINFRFAMSYISNGLYMGIIVYTLPLWLSRGGLADFVLNAFATVYIVEVDDKKDDDTCMLLKSEPEPPESEREPLAGA